MNWDNLRDAEGERNAKERAGRNSKLLTTIITAVVLNGLLLIFTYPFFKDALLKNSAEKPVQAEKKMHQPSVVIEDEINQSVKYEEKFDQPPIITEAQAVQASQVQREEKSIKIERRSLRECMKPGNLIDNDVLKCAEGLIEKSW
ncbi:hypothetical protein [Cellvibrio polysaccharolyticus]|uniref:Uncharacterized protein n=1 Tax=Cellvibrio polysaccharolyticus TaxID=2082724 RepID=A0A928V095_9GAMM|nr:hypothetical protein [Cellvibrio polysaccharolyticus]MBE8716348.1 hypothetical protein [Cellvibrio polysaccharolyticus]